MQPVATYVNCVYIIKITIIEEVVTKKVGDPWSVSGCLVNCVTL
jgi:hypothetical protein